MKKFFEWLKDILYDAIDYIMIIGIIAAVVFIIGWRLDLLFAKDASDFPSKEIIAENPEDINHNDYKSEEPDKNDYTDTTKPEENNELEDNNNLDNNDNEINENETHIVDNNENQNSQENQKVVTVVIPPGSLPSKIASILEEHNLITDRLEFIRKTQEMKLDTKLKSGTFQIKTNSSLEEIIKTIAK